MTRVLKFAMLKRPIKSADLMSQEVSAPTAGFCPSCGTKLQSGAMFCSNCGFNLRGVFQAVTPSVPSLPPSRSVVQVSKAVLAILLVTIAVLGVAATLEYGINLQQSASLQNQNRDLSANLVNDQSNINSLRNQISSLESQVSSLTAQMATLNAQSAHPTVTIWTVSSTISPGSWGAMTIPDTFDYHDTWTSSGTITVYYLSVNQFPQFYSCSSSPRIGCVTGTYYDWGPTTTGSDMFTLGEGCGGYIAVYYNGGTTSVAIYPNVSVTYNPASTATGACV